MAHWSAAFDDPEMAASFAPYDTADAGWTACRRADWMLSALAYAGADRPTLIRSACACARSVLHLVPEEATEAARRAIETSEAWADGRARAVDCDGAVQAIRVYTPAAQAAAVVARSAAHAAKYWEVNFGLDQTLALVATNAAEAVGDGEGEAYDAHLALLADRIRLETWPVRGPSFTELRRSSAPIAVAWDLVAERVNADARLTTVQLLSSWSLAVDLGLDRRDATSFQGVTVRAVAERLQLVPEVIPTVRGMLT